MGSGAGIVKAEEEANPTGIPAGIATPVLLKGTWTILIFAMWAKSSVAMCVKPPIPVDASPAETVAWLAADDCFTTGETIAVSGGAHLLRLPTRAELRG